jgi:putative transposase
MLSNDLFEAWCKRLGYPERTILLIVRIRSSPPSRTVQSRRGNVSGRYPSLKMEVAIQFESHTVELPAIHKMDRDPNVLEFYDQPPPIKLEYEARNGRRVGVLHTPDFFVLNTDSAAWEEWKMEEELVRLAEEKPNRYVRGEDGRWRCPPGVTYAKQFGLEYHVRSSAELDPIFQRNLVFLEDYYRGD